MKRVYTLVVALLVATICPAQVQMWQSTEDGQQKLSPGTPLSFTTESLRARDRIEIDTAKQYQSMLGMGASLEHATCENLAKLPEAKREEVITSLVDPVQGIGMNLMRLCIGTSDFVGEPYYSYNDLAPGETDLDLEKFSIEKDRAYLLPAIKIAQAKNPDLLFFASPWSPPGWMKTGGTMNGGRLRPEFYDVYARYLIKYLEAYRAEGIPIYAMTLQNEPQHTDPNYPTTLWTGEEQRDFIAANFGPHFAKSGFDTLIWCWDHNWSQPEFPRAVLSAPDAAKYVQGSAWHLYEGKVDAQSKFKEEFPDKDIYFSEGSTFGTRGAGQIIDILRNWARSYNAWVIMLDQHRKPNRGPHNASATCIQLNDDGSVEYRFDYYMYGQFMKFIPRGAVRVESGPSTRELAQVAFLTPDKQVVLVVANTQREPASVVIAQGQRSLKAELPARSVTTYRWPAE